MTPLLAQLRGRLVAVPPFTLGFVLVCLLQSGVDRVDPTSGQVERFVGLLLLAFATSGLLVALVREPPPERVGSARSGLLLRAGLAATAGLLLALVLTGVRLNPLADVQFVVSLLLVALVTLPQAYDPSSAADRFLNRWAVPLGATALAVSVPLTVAKLLALPG